VPGVRRVADFRQDVGLGAHALVAARVRHYAEAAELIAALDDRDVRLDRIVSRRHAKRPRYVVLRAEVDPEQPPTGPRIARSAAPDSRASAAAGSPACRQSRP